MSAVTDWPPIGSRVRYPSYPGGAREWHHGIVADDARNNEVRVAVDRDGYRAGRNWVKAVRVMRNRSRLELVGG